MGFLERNPLTLTGSCSCTIDKPNIGTRRAPQFHVSYSTAARRDGLQAPQKVDMETSLNHKLGYPCNIDS
jgi:hypothetical protein